MSNGQARIFGRSKYRYSTQYRRNGPGTVKFIQCHRNETILQLRERGITNYDAQKIILALAPQKQFDRIIPRPFFLAIERKRHYQRLFLMLLARYVIANRMERMSRDADKRLSLLARGVALLLSTWKQNEQRSETVFELLIGRKTIIGTDIAMKTCERA